MKVFFAGAPTGPDVRKLIDAFGDLKPGDEITHDAVAEACGVAYKTDRYRAVTHAWRRKLLDTENIELGAVAGVGFRVLSANERLDAGFGGVKSGARKISRAVNKAGRVKAEDDIQAHKQSVLVRAGAAMAAEMSSAMRQIEPPRPPEQSPRMIPQ